MTEEVTGDPYVITWDSPGDPGPEASMPIGNGDVAANVYVERNGELVLLIAKSDAFSSDDVLEKLGRVRIALSPSPFREGMSFTQTLRMRDGHIEIVAGDGPKSVTVRVWIDAHHPVVHVGAQSREAFACAARVDLWREGRDTLIMDETSRLLWYTRNTSSIYEQQLTNQNLEDLLPDFPDPTLNLTYGCAMQGEGLVCEEGTTALTTPLPANEIDLQITVLCERTPTPEDWLNSIRNLALTHAKQNSDDCFRKHCRWWNGFWDRSSIHITENGHTEKDALDEAWCESQRAMPEHTRRRGGSGADVVTQAYIIQRYLAACCGRGALPIKFNGALFSLDNPVGGEGTDPDYRRWGGHYWFQNTRLTYWPMLASGDIDLMEPFFRMYLEMLPFREAVTKKYYDHGGAFYPETVSWWGLPREQDYGVDPEFRAKYGPGEFINPYIRYYWSGALELCIMLLDVYTYAPDERFLAETLLPITASVLRFYEEHYPRDEEGRIRFEPAQSLETYWHTLSTDASQWNAESDMTVSNPMPEIAGLHYLVTRLLEIKGAEIVESVREEWRRLLDILPDIPLVRNEGSGEERLAAAECHSEIRCNEENPELYAVFPYRLFGIESLAKRSLNTARRSLVTRISRAGYGWSQDEIQFALCGMTNEARAFLERRARSVNAESRFPFWGPNYDWVPDMDHGGALAIALQMMLMQCEGERILLLPAWPREWDVEFRLHAPGKTVVEGVVKDGAIGELRVTPESRMKDVIVQSSDTSQN